MSGVSSMNQWRSKLSIINGLRICNLSSSYTNRTLSVSMQYFF